jgi:hypothetical protein
MNIHVLKLLKIIYMVRDRQTGWKSVEQAFDLRTFED